MPRDFRLPREYYKLFLVTLKILSIHAQKTDPTFWELSRFE